MNDKKIRIIVSILASLAIISAMLPWHSAHLRDSALKSAENGDNVQSLHLAEKAVFYNPLSIEALIVLAGAEQRMGKTAAARETLLKATEIQPLNYQTWEQLAIYERDYWHDPESARSHYQKAVELNPQDPQLVERAGLKPNSSTSSSN